MAVGGHERSVIASGLDRSGREFQRGLDVIRGEAGVGFLDVGKTRAGLQHFKRKVYHDPGPLEARFTVTDVGIDTDIPADVHVHLNLRHNGSKVNSM